MIHKNANGWNLVWRSIKSVDLDKNGFLTIDELESCFRDIFPFDFDGKSAVHFFRNYSTDHDISLVNYRRIKEDILKRILRTQQKESSQVDVRSDLHPMRKSMSSARFMPPIKMERSGFPVSQSVQSLPKIGTQRDLRTIEFDKIEIGGILTNNTRNKQTVKSARTITPISNLIHKFQIN